MHHPFNMGDWLINYNGGFIRRGFLGTSIIYLSQINNLNPGINTIIFQIIFYTIFFWYSYKLLKKQQTILPYIFLIFSPFIFTFQINDIGGGFRKEIIYFALFAFLVFKSLEKNDNSFKKIFYASLLLYSFLILTHEIFIIFLPYILIIFTQKYRVTKKNFLTLLLFLAPSIIAFIAVIFSYVNNNVDSNAIFLTLANQNYPIEKGAIYWLKTNSTFNLNFVMENINAYHYYFTYSLALTLGIVGFIPLSKKLYNIFINKISLFLILISILGSIPLFIVAADWGRFIYIHLVSWFLLSLLNTQQIEYKKTFHNFNTSILIFLYFSFWHIPHCCSNTIFINKNNNIIKNWLMPYMYVSAYYMNNSSN